MNTFIEHVLSDLKVNNIDFSNIIFVLPSKRAGVFIKSKLKNYICQTNFAPEILSIEDFVKELSQLNQVSGVELLFQFYDSYKKITDSSKIESFESFSKWAQILIQDFNEIDRYLITPKTIFEYLSAIQELNHWSLEEQKTDFIINYLSFWNNLKNYYTQFTDDLIAQNSAYQGLIYKEASENLESYIQTINKTHVFLGFNALNSSESRIIQELLQNGQAQIYWDIDEQFLNNDSHSAGLFARKHKAWAFYKTHPFKWTTSTYQDKKTINVIGCPKSIGQSKYVGNLLNSIAQEKRGLSKTAIVLGDESLLTPMLNAIPENINTINVTMGLPLESIPLAAFFHKLFSIHKTRPKKFYYKDIIAVISHQMIQYVITSGKNILQHIQKNNITYLSAEDLTELSEPNDKVIIQLLFKDWNNSISKDIERCQKLIYAIKEGFNDKTEKRLELEYLYRFNVLFNEILTLNSKYKHITDISSLETVYKELLSNETLDFQGEPLEGLQIIGMLESRVLDFETVIITSVNEGILPGGKTNNSFIPFDVKLENNLPTYKEKDAVYTYHFYSLIQRAKNVYLIYNTEIDALKGGEKSRFITQLEVEGIHEINHKIISPPIPSITKELIEIKKTKTVIDELRTIAEKGFSPSSLTNYIRNPIDFYSEKILGIKNTEDVEETIAANTLGTVIHNTLEVFYKPFEGHFMKVENLKKMTSLIDATVIKQFEQIYKKGDISQGKNLITFEIAKRYISNFIQSEIELLKNGNTLKILAIEVDNSVEIDIPKLNFPIKLKGKVDRVDELNDVVRIIDYKSGKVEQNNVEIVEWDLLNTDYKKFSKPFQILCYAYMLKKEKVIQLPVEAGIISFKNLNQGFLKFATKESTYSRTKNHEVSEETLQNFEIQLKNLIVEICNPDINFIEKELD
ncbi:MAG: PD-(D/E)XK nuclease family protein [Winogradskyella sp.]|uniref:PD-(D/E)XK nuclease family protein n=1 Tax=Winogradskyella sp. TaxID=1883156 RepID=UPI001799E9F8|nr:PD-(D/E)XK nuclease family protein [Winogradskyella sp.]MBT8246138.1 PD-(D/E)XK nuclease family protein [Winogradskyella sp.]NNK23726.1 PD-(D/E)XK nuclease family protein [Winogradskyella sp.]